MWILFVTLDLLFICGRNLWRVEDIAKEDDDGIIVMLRSRRVVVTIKLYNVLATLKPHVFVYMYKIIYMYV